MKFVVNTCFGGFGLSKEAQAYLDCTEYSYSAECLRNDENLIKCVEELKGKASGHFAELHIMYVPDDATDWMITNYDGVEEVLYVLDGKMRYATFDESDWEE